MIILNFFLGGVIWVMFFRRMLEFWIVGVELLSVFIFVVVGVIVYCGVFLIGTVFWVFCLSDGFLVESLYCWMVWSICSLIFLSFWLNRIILCSLFFIVIIFICNRLFVVSLVNRCRVVIGLFFFSFVSL